MGEAVDGSKSKRTVFVTVGTTCFDSLVRAVERLEMHCSKRAMPILSFKWAGVLTRPQSSCCHI
ncbi:hypothetical protein OROMI_013265 [Orobanche minor]